MKFTVQEKTETYVHTRLICQFSELVFGLLMSIERPFNIEDYPLVCIFAPVLLASQQSERVQLLKTVTDAIIKWKLCFLDICSTQISSSFSLTEKCSDLRGTFYDGSVVGLPRGQTVALPLI